MTHLEARDANIRNLTGLEHATNLKDLRLDRNAISDISVLAGLTDLTGLGLDENSISDISALAGLTNLTNLLIGGNNISDISVLAELTDLRGLSLYNTNISDISAITELTDLTRLWVDWNNISNLSPLVANIGLGEGDAVYLRGNPLSYKSINIHIPALKSRGVTVEFNTRTVERLLKISGDNQQGTVGEELTDPFVVEVQDRNGAVFAEVPVTFAVTRGNGTLSITSTTTDANGRAESRFTPSLNTAITTVTVEGISASVTFTTIIDIEFLLSVPAGTNLIHVPLKVTAVDGAEQPIASIADLYAALGGAETVNFLITYDFHMQAWLSYFGESDRGGPADRVLTDETGIVAGMKTSVTVRLTGTPLGTDGTSTITLNSGVNLVGLPLNAESLVRVSDLFTLDGIRGNVGVIIVTEGGEFQLVGRAGDLGDIPLTGGQGFILTAQQAATVSISGSVWDTFIEIPAAPLVTRKAGTTPVLGLRGSVVDEEGAFNTLGFRVTVKNLSNGKTVTGMTRDEEVGYQLTVVDIESGDATTIGDTLEITAQSPNPFIGVEPVQYTVTAEDVRQSLIQLPELVAYEIPAENQLLANYPNPFNPETWIPYRLADDAFVTLTIYDLNGRVARTIDMGYQTTAVYESRDKAIYWDGRNEFGESVASGAYFYHLSAGNYSATRKMLIIK